jgi:hypothetical protein
VSTPLLRERSSLGYNKYLFIVFMLKKEVFMYRELVVRAYSDEAIKKIDKIRRYGINMTDLVIDAIMRADIKYLLQEKKRRMAKLN